MEVGPLAVEIGADALRLTNRGDRMVFTFVADREALALLNWAACADPVECPGLAPGESRTIPYGTSTGPAPGREAVVTWWYSRRTADGYEPDSLRAFVLQL